MHYTRDLSPAPALPPAPNPKAHPYPARVAVVVPVFTNDELAATAATLLLNLMSWGEGRGRVQGDGH